MILRQRLFQGLAAVLFSSVFVDPVLADDADGVVATIKPVHSLVSAVMAGVGEPKLLMRGMASPHTYNLRPSDARMLQGARLIVMIGENMETSLAGPIDRLANNARVVRLSNAPGLILKPVRSGRLFAGEHDHHHHDHGHHGHGDSDKLATSQDAFDTHLWLDPVNAVAMASAIADAMSEFDPRNEDTYQDNARQLSQKLKALTAEIDADLVPVRDIPFIVFHDAYQYFEDRFGLSAVAAIKLDPQQTPGIRRIQELRAKVRDLGVACVLAEPQFDQGLVDVVNEETPARSGIVDPLGSTVESGPNLYFTLLRNLAASVKQCLAPQAAD